jgi:RNA ligase (TIGR02306 family)
MKVATVDGWEVVFNQAKNFKVDQPVVFFEIDSFLPASNRLFANMNLNQTSFGDMRGHLVSPVKYNKQISQGLIYHLADFPEIKADKMNWYADVCPGYPPAHRTDYAAKLGVVKFCLDEVKAAEQIGPFPSWIQKADMDRVQNIHQIFKHLKYGKPNRQFQESVKMDGQTMTCYYIRDDAQIYKSLPEITRDHDDDDSCLSFCDSGRFGVCTRTCDRRYLPTSIHWQAALHYGLRDKLAKLGKNIAIQGELVGSTIEGNSHGYADGEHEFFLFSVYDVDTHERWDPRQVEKFADDMGLNHVPVRGYSILFDYGKSVDDMVARADAQEFEGLVYKSVYDGRWFKVISPDYLMRRQAEQKSGKKKGGAKL